MTLAMLLDLLIPSRKRKREAAQLELVRQEVAAMLVASGALPPQRPKRVTVDPYSGFVKVTAGSIEEAVHIVMRAPEFGARAVAK